MLNCPHAWWGHGLNTTHVSGSCLPCFPSLLKYDIYRVEGISQSWRQVEQTQNQGKTWTLKHLVCFYPEDLWKGKFILPITAYYGQQYAMYRCHILRENHSLRWFLVAHPCTLKCPSNYLTKNKSLGITAILCWLLSLCQAFAVEFPAPPKWRTLTEWMIDAVPCSFRSRYCLPWKVR